MPIKRRKKPKPKRKLPRRKEKKSELQKMFDFLMDRSHKFWWFSFHTNCSCIKCAAVEKEMVRVGILFFCVKCFSDEFNPKDKERDKEKYDKWMEIQGKVWDKELK